MARIMQSTNFFYPAKERAPADERPQLTFALGLIAAQNGPYADGEVLKEAALQSMQPVA
jgi:hypothetical protein